MNRWVIFENSPQENNGRFGCSFTVKYRELTGFLNQIPLKLISFVIASAIMLSACGGGGGGGSPETTVPTPFSSVVGQLSSAAAQGKVTEAANAEPADGSVGSVTQSSNTLNGITTDSVLTSVEYNDNGQLIYKVQNGTEWDVDSAASDTDTLNKGRYTDTDWNFAELHKKLEDGRLWVGVYSDISRPTTSQEAICGKEDTVSAGETCRYEGGGNNFTFTVGADGRGCVGPLICTGGNKITTNGFMATGNDGVWTIDSLPEGAMPVAGSTQTISMPDTDFLAGGIWVYVPDEATSVVDFTFGAFVHGEDPYTQTNLIGLTGQYTYTGDAIGVYSVLAEERNYFFDADVTLTADFEDNSTLGKIEGHIDNVSVDDELVEGDPTLNLGSANIVGPDSGFFKGATEMMYEGESYTGKWGGQFFGNDDSNPPGPPGSVAGTFGAATIDGANSVLGVYGAGSPTQVGESPPPEE